MKTVISIPIEIFSQAEKFVRQQNMTRSSLFTAAIEEYIHHHREEGVSQKLNAAYGQEESSLDPVVARIQSRSLPKKKW